MKIFNTLSAKKEEFLPPGAEVKMYNCGVTPYDQSHLGHAMNSVIFDAVRRYLIFRGYKVKYVQNITDVEDKIIDRANRLGIKPRELAEKFADEYFDDMKALNVLKPDVIPYATEEIPTMLQVISGLVDKGNAYEAKGSVYFRIRSMPDYGKLSHNTLDSMMAGSRVEVGEDKEHPLDFTLWKAAKPGEPAWDSPWGKGRPGWHIECTAMSIKYLGDTIDIHSGGQDLIFPHHENEIAQSECYTGKKPFVKYWMHNGLFQQSGEKMSKSLGNFQTIKQVLEQHSSDGFRLFLLSAYYRSPSTYSEDAMEAAEKGAERLRQAANSTKSGSGKKLDAAITRQKFIEYMDDDFGTSQAIAALFDLARDINRSSESGMDIGEAQQTLKELSGVLGLTLKEPLTGVGDAAPFIELLIFTRKRLREAKQFQLADEVRNKLVELGVTLEDSAQGTTWKFKK